MQSILLALLGLSALVVFWLVIRLRAERQERLRLEARHIANAEMYQQCIEQTAVALDGERSHASRLQFVLSILGFDSVRLDAELNDMADEVGGGPHRRIALSHLRITRDFSETSLSAIGVESADRWLDSLFIDRRDHNAARIAGAAIEKASSGAVHK